MMEMTDDLYNQIVTRMINDGYIDKQWTPEERQEWVEKMTMAGRAAKDTKTLPAATTPST